MEINEKVESALLIGFGVLCVGIGICRLREHLNAKALQREPLMRADVARPADIVPAGKMLEEAIALLPGRRGDG